MKIISSIILCLLLNINSKAQTTPVIYDINNNSLVIDSMAGKKILVIILPLQRDTGIVHQLVSFQNSHDSLVKIIGMVCWGNNNPAIDTMRSIYAEAVSAGVFITQGMQPGDSAVDQRQAVIKWLSAMNADRTANPFALGSKYFISRAGRLYAQPGSSISLDSHLAENILRSPVPGE